MIKGYARFDLSVASGYYTVQMRDEGGNISVKKLIVVKKN